MNNVISHKLGVSVPKTKVGGGFETTTATVREDDAIFSCCLNESNVPPEYLPKAREWFQHQMERCAEMHGTCWPEHREWVADYINEELRQHLESKGVQHAL